MGIPMGFLLVVGFSVVLLASLQILILAYVVDTAKSNRQIAAALQAQAFVTTPRPTEIQEES